MLERHLVLDLVLGMLVLCSSACDGGTVAPASGADPVEPRWSTASEPDAPTNDAAWAEALAASSEVTAEPTAKPTDRDITFNGKPARKRDLEALAKFERAWGVEVPSGDYWYDDKSGAAGQWGGPTRGFLGPGLDLGGVPVPAVASGGGDGRTTGVFINGRELHPLDVQGLTTMLGTAPVAGQWWVDGQGNFGAAGQPAIGNLLWIAAERHRGSGGSSYYKSDIGTGSSTFVGSGCAAVHGRRSPSDSDSSYSYYVGCE